MKRRKTGYFHTFQWYSDNYGLDIMRVWKAGKREWPLDDPKKLLELFESVPGPKTGLDTLRALVKSGVKTKKTPKPLEVKGSPPTIALESLEPVAESLALAGGLMHELTRLKRETSESYQLYQAEADASDRVRRHKVYMANVAALRQFAKEAPKAERDAKNVMAVSDIEAVWSRALKEMKTSLEALPRRVATLPIFTKLDPVDVEQAITKEIVAILSRLEDSTWIQPDDAS